MSKDLPGGQSVSGHRKIPKKVIEKLSCDEIAWAPSGSAGRTMVDMEKGRYEDENGMISSEEVRISCWGERF